MENKRINWVQSIRGLAAIFVVITHVYPPFERLFILHSSIFSFITVGLIDTGKIGVAIMFLISGYFLPYSIKNKNRKVFLLNRFSRLYPAYWFSILLSIIFVGNYTLIQLLGNVTMFQMFFGINDLVGAYWTLPMELILYFFCIILKNKLSDKIFIMVCFFSSNIMTLGMALIRYETAKKLPVALMLIISISLLGYFYRLYSEKEISVKYLMVSIIIFIIFLIPITLLAYSSDMGNSETWYRYFCSYTTAIIVFSIFFITNFSVNFLNLVGKVSYSLYLTHGVILAAFIIWQSKFEFNALVWLILLLSTIIFVANISFYLVENKSKKLEKYLMKIFNL